MKYFYLDNLGSYYNVLMFQNHLSSMFWRFFFILTCYNAEISAYVGYDESDSMHLILLHAWGTGFVKTFRKYIWRTAVENWRSNESLYYYMLC